MTDKPKNTGRPGEDDSRNSRRNLILWLIIVASVAAGIAICIALGVLSLMPVWFTENPRMNIRRIEITSKDPMYYQGYWNNNKPELLRRLELATSTSLWQCDSGELRGKLEDPRRFSSIQRARVYKELPDTLRIELTERTPLAFVGGSGRGRNELVVDDSCMLIKRRESMVSGRQWNGALPVITGITQKNPPGVRDQRLAPAVALIMEAQNKTGADLDLKIIEIELQHPKKMICRFRCGNSGPEYNAIFPIPHYDKKLATQLLALKATLLKLREEGLDRRDFDLSFEGQVVVKGRKEDNTHNHKNGKTQRR